MRLLFSLVGLLVVVAIVMLVARQQLRALPAAGTPPAGAGTAPAPTPQQRALGAQQQVLQGLDSALQQGAQRASEAGQ